MRLRYRCGRCSNVLHGRGKGEQAHERRALDALEREAWAPGPDRRAAVLRFASAVIRSVLDSGALRGSSLTDDRRVEVYCKRCAIRYALPVEPAARADSRGDVYLLPNDQMR